MILNDTHIAELRIVRSYEFMGGAAPVDYRQWRRFEAMRKARLLKYAGRKSVRWDRTFYHITPRGDAALPRG